MSETAEKIKRFRATIKDVRENFKQPLGHPCLIAQLDVCEKFMAENNDKSIWGSYGRGSVRHFTNDLRRTLIEGEWKDGSDFSDSPLFFGWSIKQIEKTMIDDASSIPELVMGAYDHYQCHKKLFEFY